MNFLTKTLYTATLILLGIFGGAFLASAQNAPAIDSSNTVFFPAGPFKAGVEVSFNLNAPGDGQADIYIGPGRNPLNATLTEQKVIPSGSTSLTHTFDGLEADTQYYFGVILQNGDGKSAGKGSYVTTPSEAVAQTTTCALQSIEGNQQGRINYSDSARPEIALTFEGNQACVDKIFTVSLKEADPTWDNSVSVLSSRTVKFPEDKKVTITLKAGEEHCDFIGVASTCNYYIEWRDDNGPAESVGNGVIQNTYQVAVPNARLWELQYTCDDSCDTDWEWVSIEPRQTADGTIIDDLDIPVDERCRDAETNEQIEGCYSLLAPLPGIDRVTENETVGGYLNTLIQIIIGVIGLLSVVMIIVGGIQYMSTDAIAGKDEGRQTIQGAVLGLLLALGSFVILNTIDPDLTRLEPDIPETSIQLTGGDATITDYVPLGNINDPVAGVQCPVSGGVGQIQDIVNSLNGKTVYRMGGKNFEGQPPYPFETGNYVTSCVDTSNPNSSDVVCLDCSGFVNYVYYCAGLIGGMADAKEHLATRGTKQMFSSSSAVVEEFVQDPASNNWAVKLKDTNNPVELQIGDLLGWSPKGGGSGHVIMYIGNGKTAESTSIGGGRNSDSIKIRDIGSPDFYGAAATGGRITNYLPRP
jgi:cell wall-associated NlpC family hydrolase